MLSKAAFFAPAIGRGHHKVTIVVIAIIIITIIIRNNNTSSKKRNFLSNKPLTKLWFYDMPATTFGILTGRLV